jgi:hypothetical protein
MADLEKNKLLAAEMGGHYTYSALAKGEDEPQRRNALRGLAAAEKHHADLWAGRIEKLGGRTPQYTGSRSGQADSLATYKAQPLNSTRPVNRSIFNKPLRSAPTAQHGRRRVTPALRASR